MRRPVRGFILGVMLAATAGCDPFASMTVDKNGSVPDGEGAGVELLTPKRRLPASAVDITFHVRHFQDTSMALRFEAPLADARAFAGAMLKSHNDPCLWRGAELEGWPDALPPGASCGRDHVVDGDGLPAITVAVIPRNARAVVLVHTFSD